MKIQKDIKSPVSVKPALQQRISPGCNALFCKLVDREVMDRRKFTRIVSSGFMGMAALPRLAAASAFSEPELNKLISAAGNAENHQVTYKLLLKASELASSNPSVREEFDAILPYLDYWANFSYRPDTPSIHAGANGYLPGFFWGKVKADRYLLPEISEESPLYPVWCWYRGLMLVHVNIESGSYRKNKALRDEILSEARILLHIASERFPQNRVIQMYLDRPFPEGFI